jgi:hypothetical protein
MKRLDGVFALVLALGLSAGCVGYQTENEEAARPNDRVQPTGDAFVSEAREALDELNAKFRELETSNADLQGESATAWADAREEIVQVRQELATDLDRLGGTSTQDADEVRARVAQNLESMTHHVERAELLATDGNEEFISAARERLAEADRDIQSLQADAARLPMEAREDVSQSVEELRSQANNVRESVTSFTDAGPQEIAEQRDEVAEDVASLTASVRREAFELQAELEN